MPLPNYKCETELLRRKYKYVAGVDEVGRGPLAGPVVAAAVILSPQKLIKGVQDSKKISDKKRRELFSLISQQAQSIGIGIVDVNLIDKLNIFRASLLAMKLAVQNLSIKPDYILIDGNSCIDLKTPQMPIVKGDTKSMSIAAASIIAKVTRDNIMLKIHKKYPKYGFDKHKGYGTVLHFEMLTQHGISPVHRKSWDCVSQMKLFS